MCHSKLSWLEAIPLALMSTRSSVHSATGFTPYELACGQQFPGPGARGVTDPPTPFLAYKPYYDQLTALVAAFSEQVAVIQGRAEQSGWTTKVTPGIIGHCVEHLTHRQGPGGDVRGSIREQP